MLQKSSFVVVAGVLAMSVAASIATSVATAGAAANDPSIAVYEGRTIDLEESWEGAGACAALPTITECYDTEAEMFAAHPEIRGGIVSERMQRRLVDCSSSLRLYDGTSYTGTVLLLAGRGLVHNMSTYGFDNRTSSYKMGACGGSFFSGANAGGSVYGGNTSANAQATAMLSGWNNVVSSVYIN